MQTNSIFRSIWSDSALIHYDFYMACAVWMKCPRPAPWFVGIEEKGWSCDLTYQHVALPSSEQTLLCFSKFPLGSFICSPTNESMAYQSSVNDVLYETYWGKFSYIMPHCLGLDEKNLSRLLLCSRDQLREVRRCRNRSQFKPIVSADWFGFQA